MLQASGVPQCYTVQMEVGMKILKYGPLQIEYLVKKKMVITPFSVIISQF